MLSPPVEPMLARSSAEVPAPAALSGGSWYEPKFDGYRCLLFVVGGAALVQSRRGHDITAAFPDVAAAAVAQLPPGSVVDGELVVWAGSGFDFGALQRRLTGGRSVGELVRQQPASVMLFDVLAVAGRDVRRHPLWERRRLLEAIAVDTAPPLQLVPYTTDVDQARTWVRDYAAARVGIEGLVVKGVGTSYESGKRGWVKYRIRDTVEAVVGAVTGSLEHPESLVLGYYDTVGDLVVAGATTPLTRRQQDQVAGHLRRSAGGHPWPEWIGSGRLGHWGGPPRAVTRVDPVLVVEISADTAVTAGAWRHVTRFVRVRPDLNASDVPAPS